MIDYFIDLIKMFASIVVNVSITLVDLFDDLKKMLEDIFQILPGQGSKSVPASE